jgi:hypothetical protein
MTIMLSRSFFAVALGAFLAITTLAQLTGDFKKNAEHRIGKRLNDVCAVDTDATARRIFLEYGAVFVANKDVALPPVCIFTGEEQVQQFQAGARPQTASIDGVAVTLQTPAMEALLKAREKAAQMGLKITPRGGSTASRRSYQYTRELWDSRFLPGLSYWVKNGKLTKDEAAQVRYQPTAEQVAQVLEWEVTRKTFFSKDLSKSILYSVAAPGASQHNFMLALDVQQFGDKRVRDLLAQFGWFQTVKSDLPHFTYLGLKESELPALGLKLVTINAQNFWIPDLPDQAEGR